jgi:lysophospholipase L1-like esterase
MGAIGDALTDEYTTSEAPSGQNWVEIVATRRGDEIDFGASGSWGEPRRRGYEYNWARFGATSTDMVRKNLHTGLSSQTVDFAYIGIGSNDFSPWAGSYSAIYNGRQDGSQTVDTLLENLTVALDEVAGTPDNPTGVKVIISNIAEMGATPYVKNNFPVVEKRDLVTAAEMAANDRIAEIAAERGIPVVDMFGLFDLTMASSPTTVGDVAIRNFFLDQFHPSTVWQGLLANTIMEAANMRHGVRATGTERPAATRETLLKVIACSTSLTSWLLSRRPNT